MDNQSPFFLFPVFLLIICIDLVHQRIVVMVHLVGVDRNVVQIYSQEYFLFHDGFGAVIGQLDVEETCVSLWKRLILIFHRSDHRFDHESDVIALELFAINRQPLLTPAETDDLQSVNFR